MVTLEDFDQGFISAGCPARNLEGVVAPALIQAYHFAIGRTEPDVTKLS
jgi:hypothetical protein